jgi:hypothetical protein
MWKQIDIRPLPSVDLGPGVGAVLSLFAPSGGWIFFAASPGSLTVVDSSGFVAVYNLEQIAVVHPT